MNIRFYEVKATKNQTVAANSKSKCINELYITITKDLGIIHKAVNWLQIYKQVMKSWSIYNLDHKQKKR